MSSNIGCTCPVPGHCGVDRRCGHAEKAIGAVASVLDKGRRELFVYLSGVDATHVVLDDEFNQFVIERISRDGDRGAGGIQGLVL